MNFPVTLSLYIARHFSQAIFLALGGLMSVVILLDTVELIRRTSGKAGISFGTVVEMAFMKTPEMVMRILPFSVLIGAMMALTRLNKTSELTVTRAAGVSVWQFLRPAWFSALVIGLLFVGVFNPIAAAMLERFEQLEARYISGRPSLLSISSSGLWLRDYEIIGDEKFERILHALRLSQNERTLRKVIVFRYGRDGEFLGRIDAESATLLDGYWRIDDLIWSVPGKPPFTMPEARMDTTLTFEQIQDSFASPETLSFWELPFFIDLLEESGFSAIRHKLHWQVTLASPLLLISMIFLGAAFSLRLPRRGGVTTLVVAGVFSGFVIYFLSDLVYALGLSGSLPILLAAWTPPVVVLLVGIWFMLHLEHG